MIAKTLGYQTDLMLIAYDGTVERQRDRAGDHWVARSPDRPDYYWGNMLVFDRAPGPEDVAPWIAAFERQFAESPEVRHVALGWDVDHHRLDAASVVRVDATVAAFVALDYVAVDLTSMDSPGPSPPANASPDVVVRPLVSDADWAAQHAIDRTGKPDAWSEAVYDAFALAMAHRYRRWADQGRGQFYGAFEGETLQAFMGIYLDPATRLARYQRVLTHPRARRRGICSRLIGEAATQFRARFDVGRFVIVADSDSPARHVYASCGFTSAHRERGVFRRPER